MEMRGQDSQSPPGLRLLPSTSTYPITSLYVCLSYFCQEMSSFQQQQQKQKQIARYSKNKTPEFEVTEQGQKPDSGTRTL